MIMIADKIKERLKRMGLSVNAAAKRCGISQASLWAIVHRGANPSAKTLRGISQGLNIPIEELLQEPEPVYPNVEKIMKDPTARASFEKMLVKWSQLPPEAKKSVDDYIAFVLEQSKEMEGGGK